MDAGSITYSQCQEQRLVEAARPLTLPDLVRNFTKRLLSAARRRVDGVRYPAGQIPFGHPSTAMAEENPGSPEAVPMVDHEVFAEGELVEVRSWEEIEATLDERWCTGGLAFMLGMRSFCGTRARVFKRVRTIYDEKRDRMVRIRNAYLLEGIICNGRHAFDKEGCDRCCFYFWKDRWLRKVDQS